jgi:hypothetical protein
LHYKASSDTEQRVARLLERMRKAMPEIKRQVAVYEKNLKDGKIKSPKVTILSRNL